MDAIRLSALSAPIPFVVKTTRGCNVRHSGYPKFTVRACTAQATPSHSTSSTEKLKEFSSIITVPKSQGVSLPDVCGLEPADDGLHNLPFEISSIRLEENSSRPPEDVIEGIKGLEAATHQIMKDTMMGYAAEFAVEAAERIDDAFSIPGYDKNVVRTDHDGVIPTGNAAGIGMDCRLSGLQIISSADLEEQQELGSGTYGAVYHGKWRGTDVAIKRIKKRDLAKDYLQKNILTESFWSEAQLLSKLRHPQVVSFYGVVPDGPGGTLACVTEYMVDGSLRHALLAKGELDQRTILMVLLDAAFGMEYLHSMDVIHFDLKGLNLLVNLRDPQRPVCKVADFGLSKMKQNALVSGGERGTLRWMAPELLKGRRIKVSNKVDVYSFGVTIWETLTGEVPYGDMRRDIIRSKPGLENSVHVKGEEKATEL